MEMALFRPGKNGWVKLDDKTCESQVSNGILYRIPAPSEMKNSRSTVDICCVCKQERELVEAPLTAADEEILATFKLGLNKHKG